MQGEMFVLAPLLLAVVTATETTSAPTPPPPPPTPKPCGHPTVLNSTTGEILSPNFPHSYSPDVTCIWVIQIPAMGHVFITIESLSLDVNDQLSVFGGTEHDKLITTYSGTVGFGVVYSSSNTTTLLLNSTVGSKSGSFKLSYTMKDCMVNVTSPTQVITSPVYISTPGNFKCTYTINSNAGDGILDQVMALTFSKFDVKKGEIELNDGNATVKYNDSSATSIPDLMTTAPFVTITMMLPSSAVQHFSAQYSLVDACSQVVNVMEPYKLTNPSGGGSTDCRYMLQSPEGTTLSVQFADLNLNGDTDFIQINDGASWVSPIIERFTKSKDIEGVSYLSSGNSLWIQYRTGPGNNPSTFNLTVTPLVYGRRYSSSGHFELKASNNTSVPIVPVNNVILYQFEASSVNSQVSLTFGRDAVIHPASSIKCFDGFSSQAKCIANFNTSTQFRPVFSNGNRILMVITGFTNLNGSLNAQHISGDFKSITNDGTMLNSMESVGGFQLDLPKVNVSNMTSTWLIQNHELGEFVSLDLQTVDVGKTGVLSVYSSLSPSTAPPIAKINTSDTALPLMYLPRARIEYDASNVKKAGIVYRGAFSTVDGCGKDLSAPTGQITTPMFPSQYPLNAMCAWNISQAAMLHLYFTTFDLAPKHTVSLVVRTYHSYNRTVGNKTITYRNSTDKLIQTLSGKDVPNDVIAQPGAGNELWVKFSSVNTGVLDVGQGVDMSYEAINCGGNVTAGNSTLKTPGYPKPVTTTTTCVWIISLPANNSVNASHNIVSFTVVGNVSQQLEVRDGASVNSAPIPLNATGKPKPILSRTNYLWVRYSYKAGQTVNAGGQGFSLSYTTHACDKAHQCKNGLCLHDDWKCNGEDDCGDGTDEQGCVYGSKKSGYAGWVLGLAIVLTFIIAVALTILVPILYKRARTPNYSTLRDMSVDT